MCWMQAYCFGYLAAAVHKEYWGLGFIFIAWISALFLAVAAELPCASYSNCPSTGFFFRKAVFDTILASCFTWITKWAKIQHHVKSQFSAWLSVQLSTYGNSCWHLLPCHVLKQYGVCGRQQNMNSETWYCKKHPYFHSWLKIQGTAFFWRNIQLWNISG